jgi:hypothetical protein
VSIYNYLWLSIEKGSRQIVCVMSCDNVEGDSQARGTVGVLAQVGPGRVARGRTGVSVRDMRARMNGRVAKYTSGRGKEAD